MDVSHQFKKVRILLTENRFVAVLKNFSMTAVAVVKIGGMTGQQPSHYRGYGGGSGSQQKMGMVGNQGPGKTRCAGFTQNRSESFNKLVLVPAVPKNLAAFDSSENDVMQCAGGINACISWHKYSIPHYESNRNL